MCTGIRIIECREGYCEVIRHLRVRRRVSCFLALHKEPPCDFFQSVGPQSDPEQSPNVRDTKIGDAKRCCRNVNERFVMGSSLLVFVLHFARFVLHLLWYFSCFAYRAIYSCWGWPPFIRWRCTCSMGHDKIQLLGLRFHIANGYWTPKILAKS